MKETAGKNLLALLEKNLSFNSEYQRENTNDFKAYALMNFEIMFSFKVCLISSRIACSKL